MTTNKGKKYRPSIKLLVAITVALFLITQILFPNNNVASPKDTDQNNDQGLTTEHLEADLLGKGTKQRVTIVSNDKEVFFTVSDGNKKILEQVFDGGRSSATYSVVRLNSSSPTEYIRWDQSAGTHHFETNFLSLFQGKLYNIPSADFDNLRWYAPFWTSRDQLVVGDSDSDGLAEVIEFVDEYPPDAPRLNDPGFEKITREEFSKQGISNKVDDMITILNRENIGKGRGRKVIWDIYTFVPADPPFFRRLKQKEYLQSSKMIVDAMKIVNDNVEGLSEVIARNELELDSIDFNIFVRDFWTNGQPYDWPFDATDEKMQNNPQLL